MEERYNRHHLLKEIGIQGQEQLKNSSVLIVGVGGLGSPIALYLTAAGVGRIGLIDNDVVSLTNLQRQILYREDQIGKPKVLCAKDQLKKLNNQVQIDLYAERLALENARSIISGYDLVVDGTDNHSTRYLIDDCCFELNKPYIYGSIGEFHGQVSIFNYGKGKRYTDLFPDRALLENSPKTTLGVLGAVPGIIGSIQAAEVIKMITGAGETLDGKLLLLDVLTMQTQLLNI